MAYEINAGTVEGMFTTGEPSLGGITGFTALRIPSSRSAQALSVSMDRRE
jgi:hypothetical protein